ncbi:hypothetical protein Lser_V15G41259 [Lactuca serriola]
MTITDNLALKRTRLLNQLYARSTIKIRVLLQLFFAWFFTIILYRA